MSKLWISALATILGSTVMAQSLSVIYAPVRSIKDQSISVKAWGSGTISETDEMAYEGLNSIRISTRNYFAGGQILFNEAVDLGAQFKEKSNLLRITFQTADATTTFGPGAGGNSGGPSAGPGMSSGGGSGGGTGGGARAGGSPQAGGRGAAGQGQGRGGAGGPAFGPGGPGFGAGAGRGGAQGGAMGGAMGGGMGGGASASALPAFRTMRLVITTTDNLKSEAYIPTTTSGIAERGWRTLTIPLQAITGFDRTNKQVKSISFMGDAMATFYVGEMKIINDTTPLRGEPNVRTLNLAAGDQVVLSANGTGGATVLKYSWDFNDKDGIQVDAEGQSIQRRFRTAGTYTVTLTISDTYGLKPSFTTTLKVVVNP